MKPTKGNTPGEAELSNDPTECGETAAGAAEPSPRGSNAPLEKLAVTTAFPRKVIGRRGPRRRDGGTAAGRRDGGTAGQWDDRAAGRRDNGMTGRRDGGTVGRRGNRKTAGRWDGATVGCQCSGTAGRNGRLWSGGGGNVLRNTEGGGLWSGRGGRGCRWRADRCLDLGLVTWGRVVRELMKAMEK